MGAREALQGPVKRQSLRGTQGVLMEAYVVLTSGGRRTMAVE